MSWRAGSLPARKILEHLFETSWPGAETFWQYPLGTTLLFRRYPLDIALPLWQYPSICSPALPLWQYLPVRSGDILSILQCNCGSTVAVPNRSSPRNQRPSPRRSHSAADPPHEPEFERDVELLFPVPYEK